MAVEKENTPIEQIQELKQYLPNRTQEELEQILEYGEKIKAEGERKKKEFWSTNDRENFKELLRCKWWNKKEIEGQYEYLNDMIGIEREKFIEEYLHDDMLYSYDESFGEFIGVGNNEYSYEEWKHGNIVMKKGIVLKFSHCCIGEKEAKEIAENIELKEGMTLNLFMNELGDGGAKAIARMELKEGVTLSLQINKIGAEGAKALSQMKLERGVVLNLLSNDIGDEGAKAIAENLKLKEGVELQLLDNGIGLEGAEALSRMELKEGVKLDLNGNQIGAKGAEAISKMELKEGVSLGLSHNQIGDEGAKAISYMELKEGVGLDLRNNEISDIGLEYIITNMELKNGMLVNVSGNSISPDMKNKIRDWNQYYITKGIKCKVLVD